MKAVRRAARLVRSDFDLRYIAAAVNANRDLFEMNQRNYACFRRCGVVFDPEFLRLPMTDSVLVDAPLEGLRRRGLLRPAIHPSCPKRPTPRRLRRP